MRADHNPVGDPCAKCHEPAINHRVMHIPNCPPEDLIGYPNGRPCSHCGLPKANHRPKTEARRIAKALDNKKVIYSGVDGEGQSDVHEMRSGGRRVIPGTHKYTLICVKTESGDREWSLANPNGITTVEWLEFLLSLPVQRVKLFAYAFNYDLTMGLKDVDNKGLWKLFRPEMRQNINPLKPPVGVKWGPYVLNMQGSKFWVKKGAKKRVVWDTFKFYGGPYVQALKEWKVGSPELQEYILSMKSKRSDFASQTPEEIKKYCMDECQNMGILTHALVDAHTQMGLKLKNFFGAGSTGDAMLTKMDILPKLRVTNPKMVDAVARAFFGGRFENSAIGYVPERCYNYDISSAYPFHIYGLPCLIHGQWVKTRKRDSIENGKTALVHYKLNKINPKIERSWGPFPYRYDGNICFPIESGGGWVWRDEYLAGERLYPNVEFIEAFVYKSTCDCHPFRKMAEYYRERTRIDKDSGAGIVIKLGINSSYGKLAQSVGRAKFNNWVYAGLITSNTRAQLIDVQGLHSDESNMLALATDGVFTREKLTDKMPKPSDTGTYDLKKPLGGWEEKVIHKGLFLARPGVYFPCNPTKEELKDVKARGIGKKTLLDNWQVIVESWCKDGVNGIAKIPSVSRFCGAKTSIHRSGGPTPSEPNREWVYTRASGEGGIDKPDYGQWIEKKMALTFNPMPKRAGVNPDGKTLMLRSSRGDKDGKNAISMEIESAPYDKATSDKTEDSINMKAAQQEYIEQPYGDYADFSDFQSSEGGS